MLKLLSLSVLLSITIPAFSDTLTIHTCIEKALEKNRTSEKRSYISSAAVLTEKSIDNAALPSLNLIGQASYQSDVVEFPSIPSMEFPQIPKEQARLYLDLNYPIYTGGRQGLQKEVIKRRTEGQILETEVSEQQTKEIVSRLYFSAALAQKKIVLLQKTLEDVERQRKLVKSGVENGVMLPNDYDRFSLMIISLQQEITGAEYDRKKVNALLGDWTGLAIDGRTLELPGETSTESGFEARPEVKLLENRAAMLDAASEAEKAGRRPVLALFAQGGVGRPNPFNFFETGFSPYYIAGLRLQWRLLDYGNINRTASINSFQKNNLQINKQNLENNLRRKELEKNTDIEKHQALLQGDLEAIALQENIVRRSKTQFEHGTLNASDYLNEQSKLIQLKLKYELNQVMLAQGRFERELNFGGGQ